MDGSSSWVENEELLLTLIAEALVEAPTWIANVGRAVYTWRYIDAELEVLTTPGDVDPDDE